MAIELEKRYLLDPKDCPPLSERDFWIYHQAELGSGRVGRVVPEFLERVSNLLTDDALNAFLGVISQMATNEKVKIRTRDILRFGELPRAELTVKKKHPDINGFKHYDEVNIPIPPERAQEIICKIAPPIQIGGNTEYGVYKHRHIVKLTEGKGDLDILRRANTGPITLEIETDDSGTIIIPPAYVVCQINGDPKFKMLGTGELQVRPWAHLSENDKKPYYDALRGNFSRS